MPGYVVWTVIVFAVIGACCVMGGAMMIGCHVLDRLWERAASRRERNAPPARRETVEELYGRRWTERDNDLYLTGFETWVEGLSPEGNTSE